MKYILKISLLILLGIVFSCNEDNDLTTPNQQEADELLEKKYGLVESNKSVIDFVDTSVLSQEFDYSNAQLFEKDNEIFIVATNLNNSNDMILYRGMLENGSFLISKSIESINNLDNNGDGEITIINRIENTQFTSEYSGGKIIGNSIESLNEITIKGLCQREGNETFNQCFNRESDEFCDSFIATAAYITNPSIPLLIAGLCSC